MLALVLALILAGVRAAITPLDCSTITEEGTEGEYCIIKSGNSYDAYDVTDSNRSSCVLFAKYLCGIQTDLKSDKLWIYVDDNTTLTDLEMAEMAGYIEGYATAYAMKYHLENAKGDYLNEDKTDFNEDLVSYSEEQEAYITSMINLYDATDKWWHQANLMLTQLKGLAKGFDMTGFTIDGDANADNYVDNYVGDHYWPLYYINMAGEMDDLPGYFDARKALQTGVKVESNRNPDLNEHCTASVVFNKHDSAGAPDLYFSQDSWSGYSTLYRIMKSYRLPYANVINKHIVFSSYPIELFSVDDIYVLDGGLAVYETTFHTWEERLYTKYLKPQTVPTWMRVQMANRLSNDGRAWGRNFRRFYSGTYNNQYVIADYNKFKEYLEKYNDASATDKDNVQLLKNTVYVVEMGPGMSMEYDATPDINDNELGYYPGINTPRPKLMFDYQGYPAKQNDEYVGYWGYETCARYKIFESYVKGINKGTKPSTFVADWDTFKVFKRYNNYLSEPNSQATWNKEDGTVEYVPEPGFVILSRYDLRESINTHVPSAMGGLDAKVTKYEEVSEMTFEYKSCPHDTEDNENEAAVNTKYGYTDNGAVPLFQFSTWNSEHPESYIVHHGLTEDAYECKWTDINGNDYTQE